MSSCVAYGQVPSSGDPTRECKLTPPVSVPGGIYEDYNNLQPLLLTIYLCYAYV